MNIFICLDRRYMSPAKTMIYSLLKIHDDIKLFIVCDLSEAEKRSLQKYVRRLSARVFVSILDVGPYIHKLVPLSNTLSHHASLSNYFRLLMPVALDHDIEKVLYLDTDLVILKNIDSLWNTDLKSKLFAAVSMQKSIDDELHSRLGIPETYEYFNSGVMVIDVKMCRQTETFDKVIDFAVNNPEKLKWWDQDALNAVCYADCMIVDKKYNFQTHMARSEESANPHIVHYTGEGKLKPWHKASKHPLKHFYLKCLRESQPFQYYKLKLCSI